MKMMMRMGALAVLALVSCGFGTYNRETDQKAVTPVEEGIYTFDGFLAVNDKPHRHSVKLNSSGVYVISKLVPKTRANPYEYYEPIYGARLYELPGLPKDVYAMQFRSISSAFDDKPHYNDAFVRIVKNAKGSFLEVYQYAFVGDGFITDAAKEMIDDSQTLFELKNPSRDFISFTMELWKTHDKMTPMFGRFIGPNS